jgi:hypothetical protein
MTLETYFEELVDTRHGCGAASLAIVALPSTSGILGELQRRRKLAVVMRSKDNYE